MVTQKEDLLEILKLISKDLINSEKLLTDLDSETGDGDCGSGLKRGFEAILNLLPAITDKSIGEILKKVGFTLASTIGGTSGAMFGSGFMEFGKNIDDIKNPTIKNWIYASKGALDKMKIRGENTKIGDKTLIDALEPAIHGMLEYIRSGNENIKSMLEIACIEAKNGSEKTKDMIAKKGRASYLGERTLGKVDPGSVVIYLMFKATLSFYKN